MIGGGERDGPQRHVEDFTVQLKIGRLSELMVAQICQQPLCVFAHAGQRPSQLWQRCVRLRVGQRDSADLGNRELRRNLAAQQHELGMQPALRVDDMQQDLTHRPLGRCQAFLQSIIGTGIE